MGNWSDYILKLFQSTLPRRERRYRKIQSQCCIKISIHTPTKGATQSLQTQTRTYKFQSTLPRRERHLTYEVSNDSTLFQSTLPRRERHIHSVLLLTYYMISIHTPTKGATLQDCPSKPLSYKFQSTLPRRERLQY